MITVCVKSLIEENGSVDFHTWQEADGWYTCRSGVYQGITWESDNLGPFVSQTEALDEQRADYEAYLE